MNSFRNLGVALLALSLLASPACKRKAPKLPQQASAPTRLPEPEGPKPVTPEPVQQPEVRDTTPLPVETATVTKPKPKPSRKVTRKVVPAEPPLVSTPPPTTNAKPNESLQITAELPKSAAMRQNTSQLLDKAEANLKRITRQLNDGEQAMMRQIRTYITQAKLAVNDGDLERAYNLATKADLLSSELAK